MDARRKHAILVLAVGLVGITALSGCLDPLAVFTGGWDHADLTGTAVRIWGSVNLAQSLEDLNEGFVWDTESHDNFDDYANRVWADGYGALNTFSLDIEGLDRFTQYHYRAFGEYLEGVNVMRVGLNGMFIPGGPRVHTDAASSIGLTSADLNGELTHMGGAAETEVLIEYGEDSVFLDMETERRTMTDVGVYVASITDLESCTAYHFRTVAENDANTIVGWTFQVTPGKPVVDTGLPSIVGVDTATLEGELLEIAGLPTADVWFKYGDDNPNDLNQSTPPQTVDTTGEFSAEIEGLHPDTTYWVRTVADNGVCQAEGVTKEFKTQLETD